MKSTRTLNRRFPAKGTRRRNGVIIVDPKTGTEIHIRLQRGRDRNCIRLSFNAEDHVLIMAEEEQEKEQEQEQEASR